jgi:hypothetical protein
LKYVLALVCIAACHHAEAANPLVRHELHCTLKSAEDEAACKSRPEGCSLGPPLHCYGKDPGKERREEERKAYEAASEPCTCLCPIDHHECSEVP